MAWFATSVALVSPDVAVEDSVEAVVVSVPAPEVAWLVLDAVLVVVELCVKLCGEVGGLGGSRWNMPANGVPPVVPEPTAKPSVGDVKYTDLSARPEGWRLGLTDTAPQLPPSQ